MTVDRRLTQYQKDKLKSAGIDPATLRHKSIMELYALISKNVINANSAQQNKDRQLLYNILRRAYRYDITHDEDIVVPNYEDNVKKNEIIAMYGALPGMNERIAEYLWMINIRTKQQLQNFYDNRVVYWKNEGYVITPEIAVETLTSDLFEEILAVRDISPGEWYDLFYNLERLSWRFLHQSENGPPTNRYP